MKKNIFTILILSISFIGLSQELMYEIRPKYEKAIKKEAIAKAQKLSDFIASYPSNWVKDYVSVEISANENGNIQKAIGENETLNIEQKSILQNANLFTDLEISVWYKTPNSVTEQIEKRNMMVKMTIIPDAEAEYIGGYKELKRYLKKEIIDKISVNTIEEFQGGKVTFIVNEQGKIENAEMSQSSGDKTTDAFILASIYKMPNWKPAQNAKGQPVKQKFEFSMGKGGC